MMKAECRMKKQNRIRFAPTGISSFILLHSAFSRAGQGGNRVAVGPLPRRSGLMFPNFTQAHCNQLSSSGQWLRPRRPGAGDDPKDK
jgi:hypothetical protein